MIRLSSWSPHRNSVCPPPPPAATERPQSGKQVKIFHMKHFSHPSFNPARVSSSASAVKPSKHQGSIFKHLTTVKTYLVVQEVQQIKDQHNFFTRKHLSRIWPPTTEIGQSYAFPEPGDPQSSCCQGGGNSVATREARLDGTTNI